MMNEEAILKACGGKPLATGNGTVWDFGFRKSDPALTGKATVPFDDGEDIPLDASEKVFLWETAKLANGGKLIPMAWQQTGSCVWGGGHNAATIRAACEVVLLGQPEAFKSLYVGHTYGYARHMRGWETPGEGAMGDDFAQALGIVGATTQDDPNAPQPKIYTNCFAFTEAQEYAFSAWKNASQPLRDAAKPHPFQYGKITTLDQAETEIRRKRPLTWAGNWGGQMTCGYKGTGSNRVLWNGDHVTTWNHQESCLGVWRHPELGRIWHIQNQWWMLKGGDAIGVHGAIGAPDQLPGGYFVGDAAMDYQIRTGEVRSVRDFSGFTNGLISHRNV